MGRQVVPGQAGKKGRVMERIGRIGQVGAPVGGRAVRGVAGFSVPAGTAGVAGSRAAAAPAALDGLLSLQEREADWDRDRPARRHAQDLLNELSALQRDLLDEAGPPGPATGRLDRLSALARALPSACDPRLAAVLRATCLRAAVELARRGVS